MGVFSPGGSIPGISTTTLVGVDSPLITNLTIAAANVEQAIVLPATTKRYMISVAEAKVKLAFVAGTSGATYITVPRYGFYSDGDLTFSAPHTLYVQSALAGLRVEVLSWS